MDTAPQPINNNGPSSTALESKKEGDGEKPVQMICNCKNSKCVKLYCECFARGLLCVTGTCKCSNCLNTEGSEARALAVKQTLARNPEAFRPKVATSRSVAAHKKGCNCRKSMCLKKYCECFQAAAFCSEKCRCTTCKNFSGSKELRAARLAIADKLNAPKPMKRKFAASASAAVGAARASKRKAGTRKGTSVRSRRASNARKTVRAASSGGKQLLQTPPPLFAKLEGGFMTDICDNLLKAAQQVRNQSDERRRTLQPHRFPAAARCLMDAVSPSKRPRVANGSRRSYSPAPEESASLVCEETLQHAARVASPVSAAQEKAVLSVLHTALLDLARIAEAHGSGVATI